MRKNKHQLKRHIPEKIKREVRVRCGFGCVVCGCMLYDYEHFDPPFEDCKSHDSKGITLLCGRHHSNKTRVFFPLSEVIKANSNPYAKRDKFWEELTYDNTPPVMTLGNNHMQHIRDIIIINDMKILTVDSPEFEGSPYRISASFFDKESNLILKIDKNSISGRVDNVDITSVGGVVTIKSLENPSFTLLKLSLKKQPLQFEIVELNMRYAGNQIVIDSNGTLSLKTSHGGGFVSAHSRFTAQPRSNSFGIKIHRSGKCEGFGTH